MNTEKSTKFPENTTKTKRRTFYCHSGWMPNGRHFKWCKTYFVKERMLFTEVFVTLVFLPFMEVLKKKINKEEGLSMLIHPTKPTSTSWA